MAIAGDAISENTATLFRIAEVVELVNPNVPRPRDETRDADYPISCLEHETELANAFALVLMNNVKPKGVGAVAIEVGQNRQLILRTAVNWGSQEERKHAFRKIMAVLSSDKGKCRLHLGPLGRNTVLKP